MSADLTPALNRAKAELMGGLPGLLPFIADAFAHTIVSAALHDPDDDVIARTLREHAPRSGARVISCECGHWPYDEADDETWNGYTRHQADAVRAAILGTAE